MITIITKSTCPYCSGAKKLLDSLNLEYREVEISWDPDEYQKYKDISGMRTVPQIFTWEAIKENLIGWYDDMMEQYEEGKIFKK